ncbi:hypothetical protein FOA52_000166 [Chlamydomonas sp. UWO 241]|nr:hypothetical protein FOA52_000166 [Chlamydomonas sp. UWO 241]
MAQLGGVDAKVLRACFGVCGARSATFAGIGRSVGLCKERVRQIEGHALQRLRNVARARGDGGDGASARGGDGGDASARVLAEYSRATGAGASTAQTLVARRSQGTAKSS